MSKGAPFGCKLGNRQDRGVGTDLDRRIRSQSKQRHRSGTSTSRSASLNDRARGDESRHHHRWDRNWPPSRRSTDHFPGAADRSGEGRAAPIRAGTIRDWIGRSQVETVPSENIRGVRRAQGFNSCGMGRSARQQNALKINSARQRPVHPLRWRVGIEGAVPGRVTEMPATAHPYTVAASRDFFSASATAKPPAKASPAPVVSTTLPH